MAQTSKQSRHKILRQRKSMQAALREGRLTQKQKQWMGKIGRK